MTSIGMKAGALKLGEIIAVAREAKGMTLRALEKECGVSNALISQIETGKIKDPGFATVVRIFEALDVNIERAAAAVSFKPILAMLRKDPRP